MTRKEWTELAGLIDAWWPATEFSEDSEAAYFAELQRYDRDVVEAAIRRCLQDGGAFAPSLAQVLKHLTSDVDEGLDWTRALNRIKWAIRRCSTDERRALQLLAGEHASLAAFAAEYGWERLRTEPIDDPDRGGAVIRVMEQRYHDFLGRWRDGLQRRHAREGLEAAGARRALRRVDPTTALPGQQAELPPATPVE